MNTLKVVAAIAAICVLFTYTSCTGGGTAFRTHQDSMAFAKTYFDKYPEENRIKINLRSADSVEAKGFGPISWKEVTDYKNAYDKKPVIYGLDGVALDGFIIDSTGYKMILSNRAINGLYLRLGRKYDGAYTLMTLGLDKKGNVMKDSLGGMLKGNTNSNFDNIPKCPDDCPPNFE